MKKNKGLKITALVIAVLLLLMWILPLTLKGKVAQIVKEEGHKMLNARFDFERLTISLFKNFPQASVTLDGFYLVGIDEFEKDTLVSADEFTLAVNLAALLKNKLDIGKLTLKDAHVHALVLQNGKASWEVLKADTSQTAEEAPETTESGSFSLQLKKLTVKNLNITYDDYQSNLHAAMKGFEAECSGDFSSDFTDVKLRTDIRQLSLKKGAIPYLSQAEITAKIAVSADLKNKKFTFQDNSIQLNAIQTSLDGWVSVPDSTRTEMDLKLNTNDIGFKELLSLIPAIYSKDFKDLKTDGSASLTAWAKGTLQGDSILPAFEANLKVSDAQFRYPALPAGVDAIQVHARVANPGGSADKTILEINPLSFRMAGMPFRITALVKTPVSDPDFKAAAEGNIDLANLKKVYPMEEDISFNGLLTADVQVQGRLSHVEKEQYDRIQASGTLSLKDMLLKTQDKKEVQIKQSTLTFNPQNVTLSQTDILVGKNDFSLECTLENYLAYVLKDQTLRGTVKLNSNYLNLADFSSETPTSDEEAKTEEAPATELSVIEVPRNIDLNIQAHLKKILFDTLILEQVKGLLVVKDGVVDMRNLSLQALGGTIAVNGAYSTAEGVKSPQMNGAFQLSNISFPQAYKELDMVRNLAPIFENLQGSFSGNLNIRTRLDEHLSPLLESMNGSGALSTKDVNLSHIEILQKVATLAHKSDLLAQNIKDLNIRFTLTDGRMITEPFTLKMGNYALQLEGSTGLDQTIAYKGSIALPGGEKSLLSSVGLHIGGTFSSPKVSLDTQSMASQAIGSVKEQTLEAIGNKLGMDLSSAEKQKETGVEEAQKAGTKLVEEAQKQADKLVEQAGNNPLKKAAAKAAAQALVNEAQKQADKLVQQAASKGGEQVKEAQTGAQ